MTTMVLSRQPSTPVRLSPAAGRAALRAVPTTADPTTGLDGLGATVSHARGKSITQEGDPADHIYKVVTGALRKVRLLRDGRRHIASFLLPGDYFGFDEGEQYTHTVEAVSDVTLVRYQRRSFDAVLERNSHAGRHFLGLMYRTLSDARDHLLLLGCKTAAERLAAFLLAMSERKAAGKPAADLELPMNRSDVADYLGLTIETVSRVLTRLRNRRIINTPDVHRIVILKRETLEAISAGEA